MKFMNQKEDVMDIQLTQYGKILLSKGKFIPTYYAFFDDDIIYDNDYAGGKEIQNMAEKRILEQTPRLQPQYMYTGAETTIKKILEHRRKAAEEDGRTTYTRGTETIPTLPIIEKHFALSAPMGTSDTTGDYAPAWEINFLKGDLSGAVKQLSGSFATTRIPQINAMIEYKVISRFLTSNEEIVTGPEAAGGRAAADGGTDADGNPIREDEEEPEGEIPEFESTPTVIGGAGFNTNIWAYDAMADGVGKDTLIEYESDDIILQISEHNGIYTNKNFDIEVYEISSSHPETLSGIALGEQVIDENRPNPIIPTEQLSFIGEELQIGQLLDVDPSYVEHFLDILVDREIDKNTMCGLKPRDTGKVFEKAEFDCPDFVPAPDAEENLYDVELTDGDFLEPCED